MKRYEVNDKMIKFDKNHLNYVKYMEQINKEQANMQYVDKCG